MLTLVSKGNFQTKRAIASWNELILIIWSFQFNDWKLTDTQISINLVYFIVNKLSTVSLYIKITCNIP